MSYSDQTLVYRSRTVLVEITAILFLGLFIVGFLTVLDIRMHDYYVKPIISECNPENQSEFCVNLRIKHDVAMNAQISLGKIYWEQLARNALFVGVTLSFVRLLFAVLLRYYIHKKIRPETILMIFMYGLIGSGLFLFGFLDTLYYWFQGENVPATLDWLNNAGIFNESKKWSGTPDNVELQDLYMTNVVGAVVIGFFAFITMMFYDENTRLSSRRLA